LPRLAVVTATNDQIIATIDRYVEVFSTGDKGEYLALFAPDATVEDPVGSPICTGAEAISGFWDGVQGMASSIALERRGAPRIAGGEAAWNLRAVSDVGDAKLFVDIIDVMVFADDGRITSLRAFWDLADMAPYEG
jgi:steroid Delta-isomerase